MAKKIELPEQEIIDLYKGNVWWSIGRLAKKFGTTTYRVKKILVAANCLRQTRNQEIFLIEKFLKYERRFGTDTHVEMFLARKLLAEYPDFEFWESFNLGFQLNSLAFFQSDKGQSILQKKYSEFKLELPENVQHNIGGEKIGEDAEVAGKPKSLHDFLKR